MYTFNSILSVEKAKTIQAVTLAFVGDAVYSLWVRSKLVQTADYKTADLQKLSSQQVSAKGQNELLSVAEAMFTPEEFEIFKRGRNAKKPSHAKNASIGEYNRSTGFEAVIGYLYLIGNYNRIDELLGANHAD
jgi:ribonuclease-3 family protein